jgi:hypothetical protein
VNGRVADGEGAGETLDLNLKMRESGRWDGSAFLGGGCARRVGFDIGADIGRNGRSSPGYQSLYMQVQKVGRESLSA